MTSAWMDDKAVAATDPILKYLVADSDRTVAGKIVDLDPEQQLVSEIWGMQVRICRADGTNLLRANYRTAAVADIWDRSTGGGGDIGAGAMYQSVLYNLEWGDVRESEFLSKLKDSAVSGLLSTVQRDGYNMDITSPDFTRGRIVGTIEVAGGDGAGALRCWAAISWLRPERAQTSSRRRGKSTFARQWWTKPRGKSASTWVTRCLRQRRADHLRAWAH